MQFNRDPLAANTVRAWGPEGIRVRDQLIRNHVILNADTVIHPWDAHDASTLTSAQLQPVLELDPEIIILGTGASLVFPDIAVRGRLMARGIGLEVMDTPAACRTFNILLAEHRRVAAALIVESL